MKSKGLTVYGVISAILLGVANLFQIFWLIWLTVEQCKTGFGYGTDMEILALIPMLMNLFAIPAAVIGGVFLLLHCWKRSTKPLYLTNLSLLCALILQVGLIELFIWL